MEQVTNDIENVRVSVIELRSSLHRADRARARAVDDEGLSMRVKITAICLLAFVFLLI